MKFTKRKLKEIIGEEIAREALLDFFKKKEDPYVSPPKDIQSLLRRRRGLEPPASSSAPEQPVDVYDVLDNVRGGLGKVYKAYKEWPAGKARDKANEFRTQIIGTGVSSRPEKWERLVRDVSTAEGRPTTRDPSRESYTKFLAFLKGTK